MTLLSNFGKDSTGHRESLNAGGLGFVTSHVHCPADGKGVDRGFLLLLYPKLRLCTCPYDDYLARYVFIYQFRVSLVTLLSLQLRKVGEIISVPTLLASGCHAAAKTGCVFPRLDGCAARCPTLPQSHPITLNKQAKFIAEIGSATVLVLFVALTIHPSSWVGYRKTHPVSTTIPPPLFPPLHVFIVSRRKECT